ncbi:MAG: hypothetical protein ABIJ34_04145 [archaeon]
MKKEEHKKRNLIISFFLIPMMILIVSFCLLVLTTFVLAKLIPASTIPFSSYIFFFMLFLLSGLASYLAVGKISKYQRDGILKNLTKLYLGITVFLLLIGFILPLLFNINEPRVDCTTHGDSINPDKASFCDEIRASFGALALLSAGLTLTTGFAYFLGPKIFKEK